MEKKNRIGLLIFAIIIQLPMIALSIGGGGSTGDLTALIPVPSHAFDVLYLYVLSPLLMIIFIQLLAVILANSFFKLHKAIKLKRYDYAIIKMDDLNLSSSHIFIRALILGFFGFSIGTIIAESVDPTIIVSSGIDSEMSMMVALCTLVILPFLILILLPIWMLRDSGVLCSRKKFKKGRPKLPDIEGVYRDYNSFITGYIGISSILAIIFLIVSDIAITQGGEDPEMGFVVIFTPLVAIGVSIIPLLFYEWRVNQLREKCIAKLTAQELKIIENIGEI